VALLVNVWFYMFCNILLNILLFTDFESKRARRRFRSDEKYINILFSILLEGETESLQTRPFETKTVALSRKRRGEVSTI
jgi:hypothetical protein